MKIINIFVFTSNMIDAIIEHKKQNGSSDRSPKLTGLRISAGFLASPYEEDLIYENYSSKTVRKTRPAT